MALRRRRSIKDQAYATHVFLFETNFKSYKQIICGSNFE